MMCVSRRRAGSCRSFNCSRANRLSVPALIDRREDIPALVDHFVRRHARRLGKVIDGVSPDSMRRLEAYTWPGNIRELRDSAGTCGPPLQEHRARSRRGAVERSPGRRQLPPGLAAWFGRDGGGLARQAPIPRPSCGGKAHSPRRPAWRGARAARATFRARSAGDRRAAVAAHRAAVRFRRE